MKNTIKDQLINDKYAIYNGDCMDVIQKIPNDSIDFKYLLSTIWRTIYLQF